MPGQPTLQRLNYLEISFSFKSKSILSQFSNASPTIFQKKKVTKHRDNRLGNYSSHLAASQTFQTENDEEGQQLDIRAHTLATITS